MGIINFEAAKALKEIGLEDGIEVDYIYCIGHKDIESEKDVISSNRSSVKGQFHLALAPSFSDVQLWLWENYEIWIEVMLLPNNVVFLPTVVSREGEENYEGEKTSEQAYNVAIIRACEIIKEKLNK